MQNTCCFFGHRQVFHKINTELEKLIFHLIEEKGVTTFLVGGYGEFDSKCSEAVDSAKRKYPYIKLYLIKPYFSNELNINKEYYYACYDDIIIPDILAGIHYKAVIGVRNKWMIDQSQYVIAYLRRDFGGAYDAVKYANKKNVQVLNI